METNLPIPVYKGLSQCFYPVYDFETADRSPEEFVRQHSTIVKAFDDVVNNKIDHDDLCDIVEQFYDIDQYIEEANDNLLWLPG